VSIREQIDILEDLASIDADIRRIDEELGKQKGSLDAMRQDLKSLEERVAGDRETLGSMEKTRGEIQVELRQMIQQVDRSREKLQRSRNEREANAAQRELEELRKLQRDREEEIERLTTAADQARSAIDDAESKRAAVAQELEGTTEGASQSIGALSKERDARRADRERVVTKLPVVLYRRYESIRTRRPVAIAKTHDGTCLGCHMSIPPMMFQKMRRLEEFEQCPNCRRILYYVPLDPAAPSPTRSA
jgi:predicted  nucleic acid-binding Zn-ribbon protein